jgi:magnesium chelatase subunit I
MSPILTYRQVMTSLAPPAPADLPRTLGALRASGYSPRTVKEEIRANLVARLAAGEPTFPGIVGFDDTVIPQVERALLAGHDIVLLGERGQGKTRLIRTLVTLLDEWMPIVERLRSTGRRGDGRCHSRHLVSPQRALRREARHT